MEVPLTITDFIERAETVFADRVAVVDEPDPPGGSLGRPTYGEVAAQARSLAVALDDLGIGAGERVAILSPNAARFLVALSGVPGFGRVLVPINFRLNRDEVAYIVEHSGASVLLVDPEYSELVADIPVRHRYVLGADVGCRAVPPFRHPEAHERRRARHRHDQLHVRHHGAAQGRADDPPQPLAERGHVRLAHGRHRS